jgi:hypothetical protein
MLWVGAAIGLASTLIPMISKGITSSKQSKKADELRDVKRPPYKTPRSQEQSLNILKGQATQGIPNKSTLIDRTGESTSSAARKIQETATDPASALAALTNVYGNEMETIQDVEMADAAQRLVNMQNLSSGLQGQAKYEDRVFYNNEFQPYMQSQMAASELTEASMQNKQSMLNDMAKLGGGLGSVIDGAGNNDLTTDEATGNTSIDASGATSDLATGEVDVNAMMNGMAMTADELTGKDGRVAAIKELMDNGMDLEDIAAKFNMPLSTLLNIIK